MQRTLVPGMAAALRSRGGAVMERPVDGEDRKKRKRKKEKEKRVTRCARCLRGKGVLEGIGDRVVVENGFVLFIANGC